MAAVAICSDFGAKESKVYHCFYCFHLFAMKWWDWMPWSSSFECWVLSQLFHSPFSPLSRGSLDPLWLSVIKVVSSAYLRLLLIFLPAILIPACASSGMAFCMMYSACFPGGSDGKASVYNAGDPGLIPGLGRYSGEGNGNPLWYPCLENPMDGGAL